MTISWASAGSLRTTVRWECGFLYEPIAPANRLARAKRSASGSSPFVSGPLFTLMFQGGYGDAPVELWIKLVDFRYLWADQAAQNAGPKAKAEKALRF